MLDSSRLGTPQALDLGDGLGMILVAREEVIQRKKNLILRGAQGQVKRVLTVAQLGKVIDIED